MTPNQTDLVLNLLEAGLKASQDKSSYPIPDIMKDYFDGYRKGQQRAYEYAIRLVKENGTITFQKQTHDTI